MASIWTRDSALLLLFYANLAVRRWRQPHGKLHQGQDGGGEAVQATIAKYPGRSRVAIRSKASKIYCTYTIIAASLGEDVRTLWQNLLYRIADIIGHTALAAALGELVALNREFETVWYSWNSGDTQPAEEAQVFNVFLKHTPPRLHDQLRETYGELHGSPRIRNRADDHGASRTTATPISVGETVEGVIDYERDFDYFSFGGLNLGRRYRIQVSHDTLGPASVGGCIPPINMSSSKTKSTPSGSASLQIQAHSSGQLLLQASTIFSRYGDYYILWKMDSRERPAPSHP